MQALLHIALLGLAAAGPDLAAATLSSQLHPILERASAHVEIAVNVRELEHQTTVFDWGGDRLLNPASNQKLVTAVAATSVLGRDYRFETRVLRQGNTLYLRGEGDPSLQFDDVYALAEDTAEAIADAEIHTVAIDDSAFTPRRFGPGYDPEGPGFSYMAPSGALSMQFNTLEIAVRPGAAGGPVRVVVSPQCPYVRIEVAAQTGPGVLNVTTRADAESAVVDVQGAWARGTYRVRRRVPDPGRFTASVFASAFAEITGQRVPAIVRARTPRHAADVARRYSAPLSRVVESALKYSNNFTSEQILRTLGRHVSGDPGSWENGIAAVESFVDALGFDADELEFENASGLSSRGRATPRALVDLLAHAAATHDGAAVLRALPIAGREGTLRGRLRRTRGRVRAKSGTLHNASALTGVVVDDRGRPRLGFSILVGGRSTGARARRLQDRLVYTLVEYEAGLRR